MSELIVKGKVEEVSRKENSFKVIIGGKNYYCKSDLTHLVGKDIESSYTLSEPYDFKGKMIQSKFLPDISQIAVLSGSGVSTPTNQTIPPQNRHADQLNGKVEVNWEAINSEKRRSIALSYALGCFNAGKIQLTEVYKTADSFADYMQKGEHSIPF